MATIEKITAVEIKDSRGEPTINVTVESSAGQTANASIPSGRSKGTHEALALSPAEAINNIQNVLDQKLKGMDISEIGEIDAKMIELDGTANLSNLGANAVLGTSIAILKLAAAEAKLPLYRYIGDLVGRVKYSMPTPIFNVINGAKHAKNNLVFQEFSIVPTGFAKFSDKLSAGKAVFARIEEILKSKDIDYTFGDEGGYSPSGIKDHDALDILTDAIVKTGYIAGKDVKLALDVAATSIIDFNETAESYIKLVQKFPIAMIEDPFAEENWHNWTELNLMLKEANLDVSLIGDDIFATNLVRLQKGIESNAANAIIVKPNQCGTISAVLSVVMMAKENDYHIVVSHRSGETEDSFIADLAVGVGAEFIKSGAPNDNAPERMSKYNRLVAIEEEI